MTQEAKPARTMPIPPRRRPLGKPDRRLAIIHQAVMDHGAAYSPVALAEETGLPVDAIRRFAAQIAVDRQMVALDMMEFEDGIRMGSEALAASFRILGKDHATAAYPAPAIRGKQGVVIVDESAGFARAPRLLHTADVMGLRRAGQRRAVVSPRTSCPDCGSLPGIHGGCRHQRLMTPDETTGQGLPHA